MTPEHYDKSMTVWHRIMEEATATNPHGVIYDGEKIAEIISSALREAEAGERERAAKIVDDEFERILSKQIGDVYDPINTNLRMIAMVLPEVAAWIRSRSQADE